MVVVVVVVVLKGLGDEIVWYMVCCVGGNVQTKLHKRRERERNYVMYEKINLLKHIHNTLSMSYLFLALWSLSLTGCI